VAVATKKADRRQLAEQAVSGVAIERAVKGAKANAATANLGEVRVDAAAEKERGTLNEDSRRQY
jgi:hypothetical protein